MCRARRDVLTLRQNAAGPSLQAPRSPPFDHGHHRDLPPAWLDAVRHDDLSKLHSFAASLERDRAAIAAGLTLPRNSGTVEGHVNRIKVLKCQRFGRAGFDLLRKRVLFS